MTNERTVQHMPREDGGQPCTQARAQTRRVWRDAALLFGLALAMRLIELGHPPDTDELNHLLAARSLLTEGTLQIGGGEPYTRAWLFTYLVAGMFRLFGESLVVARIPAVLAGSVLVVGLFLWVRAVAGRAAAWAASILLLSYPIAVLYSQLSRFYTLQALLFWVGALATYRFITTPEPKARQGMVLAVAAASLVLALHFQVVTAVGIAGLLLWVVLAVGPASVKRTLAGRHGPWVLAIVLLTSCLSALVVMPSGAVTAAFELFHYADPWAEADRYNVRFYHWRLLEHYATLWTLFPVALLMALSARPRAASFCGCIFGVAFLFHSFAAWKHERYLFYAMPMFFAVSGIAIAEVASAIQRRLETAVTRPFGSHAPPRVATLATSGVLAGAALFAAAGNGAFSATYRMLAPSAPTGRLDRPYRGQSDWGAAAVRLRPLADSLALVVSASDLKALYYLGRLDLALESQRLQTAWGRLPEFTIDSKVGRPSISAPESLERVIACYPSGLVVVEHSQWRQPWGVPPAAADYLLEHTEAVFDSREWRLRAFRWRQRAAVPHAECRSVITARLGEQ